MSGNQDDPATSIKMRLNVLGKALDRGALLLYPAKASIVADLRKEPP